jgi:hypothetical protein
MQDILPEQRLDILRRLTLSERGIRSMTSAFLRYVTAFLAGVRWRFNGISADVSFSAATPACPSTMSQWFLCEVSPAFTRTGRKFNMSFLL